jgi:hypothetical protein
VLCSEHVQSIESIIKASEAGLVCVEVDLRLTSDGHVGRSSCGPKWGTAADERQVVFHDDCLGMSTDVAEHFGRTGGWLRYLSAIKHS